MRALLTLQQIARSRLWITETVGSSWPNGQGVGLRSRRLRVRVPSRIFSAWMSITGVVCRLQICRSLTAQWFDSTFCAMLIFFRNHTCLSAANCLLSSGHTISELKHTAQLQGLQGLIAQIGRARACGLWPLFKISMGEIFASNDQIINVTTPLDVYIQIRKEIDICGMEPCSTRRTIYQSMKWLTVHVVAGSSPAQIRSSFYASDQPNDSQIIVSILHAKRAVHCK